MTKYSAPDDHWDDDDSETDESADPLPRVETNTVETQTHTVVIDRVVDKEDIDRYRWRFAIYDQTVVGWTRSNIEHNGTRAYTVSGTIETMPESVRTHLETELGIDDLTDHVDLPEHLQGDRHE